MFNSTIVFSDICIQILHKINIAMLRSMCFSFNETTTVIFKSCHHKYLCVLDEGLVNYFLVSFADMKLVCVLRNCNKIKISVSWNDTNLTTNANDNQNLHKTIFIKLVVSRKFFCKTKQSIAFCNGRLKL